MMEKAKESLSNGRSTVKKISASFDLTNSQLKDLQDAEGKGK